MQRKTKLAVAVGAALFAVGGAVQAQNLQVQLYGQVNRALMHADDGTQSKIFHVDGQPSSTRLGVRGTSQIAPGLRAGAQFEAEFRSNQSSLVSMAAPSIGGTFSERWFDVSLEGGWGKVNLGQGSGAADDASTIDLSGTGLANGKCACDWGGGILWRQASGAALPANAAIGAAASPTVQSVLNDYDFESRYDRVMYTTPTFGGFRAQAGFGYKTPPAVAGATGASDVKEASIWYAGKIAGDVQAALGWSEEDAPGTVSTEKNQTIGGSVSWLSAAGFNVTAAYTEAKAHVSATATEIDTFAGKAKSTWLKVGYKFGQHAIALDYALVKDSAASGDEATSIGIGYVWAPVSWAEFYAGYKVHSLDRTGVSVEDINIAMIGSRIRF